MKLINFYLYLTASSHQLQHARRSINKIDLNNPFGHYYVSEVQIRSCNKPVFMERKLFLIPVNSRSPKRVGERQKKDKQIETRKKRRAGAVERQNWSKVPHSKTLNFRHPRNERDG